jgi:hypothetical protein
MKQCVDGREKVTLSKNPTTGEYLMLCAEHAEQHRNGYTFPVYSGPAKETTI